MQRVDLLTAGQIKFTESKFYRVSGSSNQKIGIQPDITLPSQFNVEELGESNYERALDHDSIPGIAYKDFNRVSHYKNQLEEEARKGSTNLHFLKVLNSENNGGKIIKMNF